ncbi:hypothetical protein AgCh_010045 [Apium graveolens]
MIVAATLRSIWLCRNEVVFKVHRVSKESLTHLILYRKAIRGKAANLISTSLDPIWRVNPEELARIKIVLGGKILICSDSTEVVDIMRTGRWWTYSIGSNSSDLVNYKKEMEEFISRIDLSFKVVSREINGNVDSLAKHGLERSVLFFLGLQLFYGLLGSKILFGMVNEPLRRQEYQVISHELVEIMGQFFTLYANSYVQGLTQWRVAHIQVARNGIAEYLALYCLRNLSRFCKADGLFGDYLLYLNKDMGRFMPFKTDDNLGLGKVFDAPSPGNSVQEVPMNQDNVDDMMGAMVVYNDVVALVDVVPLNVIPPDKVGPRQQNDGL